MTRIRNRLRFAKDDPLRDLHVPRKDRLADDGGRGSDARDDQTGDDTDFDRDEVRKRGGIVPPEFLR